MPSNVFVDANDNSYVVDRNNNRIQVFRGVHVVSSTLIQGSDTSNNALWRNNTVPLGYQGAGGATNQLNGPSGIAVDTTMNLGYVYIANDNQHTIVQWIPGTGTGNVVAGTNDVLGGNNLMLAYPVAVRIDPLGNLFVVDNNNHPVQLYCRFPTVSNTARTILDTRSSSSTATTLKYPSGIPLGSDLNVYVAANDNRRIQKFARIT